MKLYIHIGKQPLNGYKNINLGTERIDFQNPNSICEPAECTEMILDNILSYIHLQQIPQILQVLISRLRKNGRLVIEDYNANEVVKRYLNGLLSIADLNLVLFGNGQLNKCACLSVSDLYDILNNNGLQIQKIELLDLNFSLISQRL